MKKNFILKVVIAAIVLAIACSASVFATYTVLAKNVAYTTPSGTKTDVGTALNELYVAKTANSGSSSNSDIIFEGNANTTGKYSFTFPEGKSFDSYKYLLFYANATDSFSTTNKVEGKTQLVPAEVTTGVSVYDISHWTKWYFMYSIPNKNEFSIDSFGGAYAEQIYRVDGVY